MNLKKIVAAGVAAACMMGMAACGGSDSSSQSTDLQYKDITLGETGKDIKANLKLYSNRTDMLKDDYSGTTWKQYLAEFNEMYPNIKISIEGGTDYANSALTRLQGGDWGDIMMIPEVDKSDLSTYFLSYGDVDSVKKEVKYPNRWLYENEVYGIPITVVGRGVLYNKKVFKEAGITELPKTPDEFITDLKAVKDSPLFH